MARDDDIFEQATLAAIAALGATPDARALDAWLDPAGAAAALAALDEDRATAVLRAAGELSAAEPGAAPEPRAPSWVLVTKGSAELRVAPAEGGAAGPIEARRATRVVAESAPAPDGAGGATARVLVQLDRKGSGAPAHLLVAEAWARDDETAVARVRAVAGRLARALSVPASLPSAGAAPEAESGAASNDAPASVPVRAVARYVLRGEGPRLVLRDFASRGPRERARLHFVIGLAFAALAAGAWVMVARASGEAAPASVAIAWAGGAALLTLATVAFLGVARFASRYVAQSAPLCAIGGGKLTVAPWVSRKGAVMLEPEGRFGAAIDLGEVRGVSVQDREGRHAVEIATDHGPFDALVTGDVDVARLVAGAVARSIDDLRPKSAAPTAKQRARARAAETARPAPAR